MQNKKPFYITPYMLGGGERTFSLDETESAYSREDTPTFEAGLDIKYGPTSNLTLDLTLNTDFAQVEADNQQINLTRSSLFFPEKRMFFQERSSIVDFGFGEANRLFYSRRIGIHDGSPVRIYGGARLVGRVGGWDIGMLDMQAAPFEEVSSENFGVFRARRRVFNPYSYVGGIVTSRIGGRRRVQHRLRPRRDHAALRRRLPRHQMGPDSTRGWPRSSVCADDTGHLPKEQ